VQKNSIGDSCDIWFNLQTSPIYADNSFTVLKSTSPAIKAAKDGTNIGYYQGEGVKISLSPKDNYHEVQKISISPVKKSRNVLLFNWTFPDSRTTILIHDAKGRNVFNLRSIRNQKQIILPFHLAPGPYFYKIFDSRKIITGRFLVF
jgi:hypothetical protein